MYIYLLLYIDRVLLLLVTVTFVTPHLRPVNMVFTPRKYGIYRA